MRLAKLINLILLVLLASSAAILAASPKTDPDPISGEWDIMFKVQGMTVPAVFDLKLEGDKVTGTADSKHTGPGKVRDGSWKNDKLSFTLDFAKHESIAVTGTLKDGKLVGEFTTEGFTANLEGTRKSR